MLNALLLATCATLGQLSLRGQSYYWWNGVNGRPVVSGGYAYYYADHSGVTVFDVRDPANPTPVGSYPGSVNDVHVEGSFLYAACGGGLLILDVSTPAEPTLVGRLAGNALSVVAGGGYAYVVVGYRLRVVDVSNPASPSVVGEYGGVYSSSNIVLSGDYVYIGGSSKVDAVFVANETAPTLVASFTSSSYPGLHVSGDWLYVARDKLHQVDITDPASSFVLGAEVSSAEVGTWVQADGGRLYTTQSSRLVVLDELTHAELGKTDFWVPFYSTVANGVMYNVERDEKNFVQLTDVSDPASVSVVGRWDSDDTYSAARGVVVSGDGATAFVVDYNRGLLIYDVTQPTPVRIAIYAGHYSYNSVVMHGTMAYFSHGNGFTAVDVSAPASPVTVSDVSVRHLTGSIIEGTKLYISTRDFSKVPTEVRLAIYDVKDQVPVLLGDTLLTAHYRSSSLGMVGGYLYMAHSSSVADITIYDVSNPASPQVMHTVAGLPTGSGKYMYSMVQSGSYAYMAYGKAGLVVLDVTDPAAPTVASTTYASDVRCVAVVGNTAYLARYHDYRKESLAMVDVTNPLSPSFITSSRAYGEGSWVTVHGSRVFLADKGLFVYDTVGSTFEIGCFKSNVRFLTYAYGAADNTPAKCTAWCRRKGQTYAGVEFGGQCWCGSSASVAVKTASSECEAVACTGDAADHCGSGHRVRLFSLGASLSQPTPEEVGCFSTDESPRKLDALAFTSDKTTVEECTSACEWNGYKYAGLEFGDECWCGNTLPGVRVGAEKCSLPCSGDASEMCGNGYRAKVYVVDGSSVAVQPTPELVGCFYTNESSRQLDFLAYTGEENTVELCAELCNHNGHKYAGLEYQDECWCGDALPELRIGRDQCTLGCPGDWSEMCGNAYRASVYVVDGSSVAAVSKTYEGCYADSSSRILPVRAFRDDTWCTVDECVAVCNHNGYAFAGLQARKECWCGATLPVGPPLADGSCRMSCSGNSAEVCGYVWRNSVYSTGL